MGVSNEILEQKVTQIAPWIIEKRRFLHQYPEKSGEEYQTKQIVTDTFNELGVQYTEGYYNTGVAAVIRGQSPKSNSTASDNGVGSGVEI